MSPVTAAGVAGVFPNAESVEKNGFLPMIEGIRPRLPVCLGRPDKVATGALLTGR